MVDDRDVGEASPEFEEESPSEPVEVLLEEYEVESEELGSDLGAFIARLVDQRVIEDREAPGRESDS